MKSKNLEIFTIGYQGLTISSFVEILSLNSVELLVDIREKPYSRLKDFSRKKLALHLEQANIEYRHLPQFGSRQQLRDKVRDDHDYNYFFAEYNKYLASQKDALNDLLELAINNMVCLMCFEKDPAICHRRSLAEKLSSLDDSRFNIRVINL